MAAKENKKISVSAIENVMKEDFPSERTLLNWHGLDVYIDNTISFGKMLTFVQEVTELCFVEGSGEYIPQVRQFAFRSSVVEYYTNIRLPENLTKKYEILYRTDLFESILPYINDIQLGDMSDSINAKVRQVSNLGISNIHNEVIKLLDGFGKMQEGLEGAMGEITPEVVNEFMSLVKNESSEDVSRETLEELSSK